MTTHTLHVCQQGEIHAFHPHIIPYHFSTYINIYIYIYIYIVMVR